MTATVSFARRPGGPAPNQWGSVYSSRAHSLDYDVRFRYDPDLVDLIKSFIPPGFRAFDPGTKTWSTDATYATQFAEHLRSKGYTVVGFDKPKPPPLPPPPPPKPVAEDWARVLMRRCPPELRTPLYRAMSKILHGDLGGDAVLQQELNDARREFP